MARKVKVNLKPRGMDDLLTSKEVAREMRRRMEPALAMAIATAPVDTGEYRSSLKLVDDVTDRAVCRLVSSAPHGLLVESMTGNLTRALDAVS